MLDDSVPVYVAKPAGLLAYRLLLASGLVLFPAAALLGDVSVGPLFGILPGSVCLGMFVLLPRRYEVWTNQITIVQVWRTIRVPFATIMDVYKAPPMFPMQAWIPVTTPWQSIALLRDKGFLLLVSPENREEFLRHLQRAMRR